MWRIRRIINKLRGTIDVPSLVNKGLTIGEDVFINFGCIIDDCFCYLISIGDHVTLAPNVHILAHDASTKKILGYTKIGGVKVGNYVFIGAGSIVLPGVTIGDNVVIGAGSVISKDIPSNSVAVGNPERVICSFSEYMEKENNLLKTQKPFEKQPSTEYEKNQIINFLVDNRIGFIR